MAAKSESLFHSIPCDLSDEAFTTLLATDNVRIERIVSKGHTSPETGWYDQAENEWVLVVKGAATITFEYGEPTQLTAGHYLNIPAHQKHRVAWTDPETETVWLAIHYR